MFDNITIGQFIPGKSWIYKMNPCVKLLIVIGLIVCLFLIPNLYLMLGFLGLFVLMFLTTGVPFIKMIKGMKPILFLMTFTFVLQTIYNPTGKLLYTFEFHYGLIPLLIDISLVLLYFFTKKYIPLKFLYFMVILVGAFAIQLVDFSFCKFGTYHYKIYSDGLNLAGFIFLRVVLMLSITSLLTFTTMNTDINNGFEVILSPLKIIHFPVGMLSMMLSLTLRFIPTLVSETQKIIKAQASRGVDFNEGSLKQKVNQIVSLLVPMFVISFKKADELANAMEARGYIVGAKRTKLDEMKLHVVDYITIFLFLICLAGVICARIFI